MEHYTTKTFKEQQNKAINESLCNLNAQEYSLFVIHNLPPSVVMSQKTFKGFPLFSGSIQYSPSPLESPESRMSLQE